MVLSAGGENNVGTETKDYPGYLKPHDEMDVASAVDLKAVYALVCDCHIKSILFRRKRIEEHFALFS